MHGPGDVGLPVVVAVAEIDHQQAVPLCQRLLEAGGFQDQG